MAGSPPSHSANDFSGGVGACRASQGRSGGAPGRPRFSTAQLTNEDPQLSARVRTKRQPQRVPQGFRRLAAILEILTAANGQGRSVRFVHEAINDRLARPVVARTIARDLDALVAVGMVAVECSGGRATEPFHYRLIRK
jgi:hypothetical protein